MFRVVPVHIRRVSTSTNCVTALTRVETEAVMRHTSSAVRQRLLFYLSTTPLLSRPYGSQRNWHTILVCAGQDLKPIVEKFYLAPKNLAGKPSNVNSASTPWHFLWGGGYRFSNNIGNLR